MRGAWLAAALILVLPACRRTRAPAPPAPVPPAAPPPVAAAPEPPLPDEAPEPLTPDPARGQVTIKLLADANRKAHVIWGRKDFGAAPLEIKRPRGSGPLDLMVVAPGALPLHTRVFTDHDETLSLRLYDSDAARGLLGYPRTFSLPSSSGFTQNAETFRRPRR
ncbi:MAG TPA: hypothetical protein VLT58_17975 [Polyangia bacterium]|nr:hypothetical protein [Polyangia bacterium]